MLDNHPNTLFVIILRHGTVLGPFATYTEANKYREYLAYIIGVQDAKVSQIFEPAWSLLDEAVV